MTFCRRENVMVDIKLAEQDVTWSFLHVPSYFCLFVWNFFALHASDFLNYLDGWSWHRLVSIHLRTVWKSICRLKDCFTSAIHHTEHQVRIDIINFVFVCVSVCVVLQFMGQIEKKKKKHILRNITSQTKNADFNRLHQTNSTGRSMMDE